jgi:hypothetical protein
MVPNGSTGGLVCEANSFLRWIKTLSLAIQNDVPRHDSSSRRP